MPHYFFDLVNGSGLTSDEEGLELPDLAAARQAALKAARSIISHEALKGVIDLDGRVCVRDTAGRTVLELRFADAVELRGA